MSTQEKWAILFRCHSADGTTVNHLEHVRRTNPEASLFVLYGGPGATSFAVPTGLVDDMWINQGRSPAWSWQCGDLSVIEWFRENGRALQWDRLVVIHWDCLVMADFRTLFPRLRENQAYIHALRPLTPSAELAWWWTSPSNVDNRRIFDWFRIKMFEDHGYLGPFYSANTAVMQLPRLVLERLDQVMIDAGHDEYRLPTLAKILDIDLYPSDALGDPKAANPINASAAEIPEQYIKTQLRVPSGRRIFHPVYKPWP